MSRSPRGPGTVTRRPAHRLAAASFGWVLLALAGLASTLTCAPHPPDVPPTALDAAPRTPLVLVPGATGSALRDRASGRVLWGTGNDLLFPRDGGYDLARSLATPEGAPDPVEPFAVLHRVRLLGVVTKPVYGPLLDRLEADGYRLGDLDHPQPGATLFPFAYDWRQEDTSVVRSLVAKLEALRRVRGEERLPIDLLCQSNGAHICRYLAKYGAASLDEAETLSREGREGPPATLDLRHVLLVGASNGGSLRILRFLDEGRRYIALVGRKIQPETMFSFPSLFEDLPSSKEPLFLGADGEPLEVDLYAPASWKTYGWSVFASEARRRLARRGRSDLFGDEGERERYLERVLATARRFQRLLARDSAGFTHPRYALLGSVDQATPARAVLLRGSDGKGREGGWRTLIPGDRELRRFPRLEALSTAQGDGHATHASLLALSPQETDALVGPPFFAPGPHFEMILDPEVSREILRLLAGR